MRHSDQRLVYTVTETAALLGLGRSTAYDLVARGEIATVRVGRRLFVTRPTLEEILGLCPPSPAELQVRSRPASISRAPAPEPSVGSSLTQRSAQSAEAFPFGSTTSLTSRPHRSRPSQSQRRRADGSNDQQSLFG